MSNYKTETKCIQSGYEPGMERREFFLFIRVQHFDIQAVNRWGVCLT